MGGGGPACRARGGRECGIVACGPPPRGLARTLHGLYPTGGLDAGLVEWPAVCQPHACKCDLGCGCYVGG